ncbi:MAG TPA: type II secretion system protein GspF [Myxococcales bacterium]|nr:type II secretion system protein GspF [Myxococcales bacterium]HIN85590.1 type II secretion system protein GspF [Myxococcales bacterium]
MPIYAYKGLNARGKNVNGVIDCENPRVLRADLRKESVFLTEYAEQSKEGKAKDVILATGRKEKGSRDITFSFLNRISLTMVSEMTRQLSTLLRAGIPVVDSLTAIVEQTEDERLSKVMAQVRRSVNEGMALNDALRDHPEVFPNLYCNMVRAGESSGTLELVFQRLADFIESQVKLRSQVTTALMYPLIMVSFAMLIVSLLMTFVVPKLVEVIVEQGGDLPTITKVLIWVSEIFQSYILLMIAAGIGAFYVFKRWIKTSAGELRWDHIKLKSPLFGDLLQRIVMARFSRTLGTLMGAGVPLLVALDIAKNVVDNAVYSQVIEDARIAIRDGDSIAAPLKRSGWFPPMVTQMIAIGEKTGEVEAMLDNVAEAYENQVESKVRRLTTVLEPAMIVVLGIIVACIVFAVLLPMLNMNEALRSGAM